MKLFLLGSALFALGQLTSTDAGCLSSLFNEGSERLLTPSLTLASASNLRGNGADLQNGLLAGDQLFPSGLLCNLRPLNKLPALSGLTLPLEAPRLANALALESLALGLDSNRLVSTTLNLT